MPSEKHQQKAREVARAAGVPSHASLYPRIIEHFAAALEAAERETAIRCAEIVQGWADKVPMDVAGPVDEAACKIRAEFGITEKEQ